MQTEESQNEIRGNTFGDGSLHRARKQPRMWGWPAVILAWGLGHLTPSGRWYLDFAAGTALFATMLLSNVRTGDWD